MDVKARSAKPVNDPLAALQTVESLVVLKGFHLFLTDPQLILLRKFYDPQKISGRPQNLLDEQPSHTIQRQRCDGFRVACSVIGKVTQPQTARRVKASVLGVAWARPGRAGCSSWGFPDG